MKRLSFLLFLISAMMVLSFVKDDSLSDRNIIVNLIKARAHDKVGISIGRYIYNHGVDDAVIKLQKQWYQQLKKDILDSSIFITGIVKYAKEPSVKSCFSGELDKEEYVSFLKNLNFVRGISGIPFVNDIDSALSLDCQEAAWCLMTNNTITHQIPSRYKCYTSNAARAASLSNLAYGYPAGRAILGMLRDEETENHSVGHRRWLLNPPLAFPGYGLTDEVTVIQVIGNKANFRTTYDDLEEYERRGIAWPVAGIHPLFLVTKRFSFSLAKANFKSASISVKQNGRIIPISKLPVKDNYGSSTIAFDIGKTPRSGDTYEITIRNVINAKGEKKTFSYSTSILAI
jgi:hypothetical protein